MISIKVYPADSWEGVLVWLFGQWTRRVNWHVIHWTIEIDVEGYKEEYHITGKGVTTAKQKSKPTRVWTLPYTTYETIQVLNRVEEVTQARIVCSIPSLFNALVKPIYPRVDTCISFVVYCLMGQLNALGNYPLEFCVYLSELEALYEQEEKGGI